MTSKLIVNSIRHTGASADAITMDASGNVTFPANATCSGTATGFGGGKIVQVKSVSKLDSFTVTSPTAHQYYDVTGLDNLQITTTGSNKVIVHMTVHMGIDRDGYNGFFKGVRITSGVYYNLSFPSSTGTSNRASNAGRWTNNLSVPDNYTHAMHIVGFEDSPGAGTHQYGIQISSSYNRTLYTGRPYGGEATGHVYAPSGTITLYEVEA
tara:strand:+ start:9 stop:638 length:630 start_codon:yes stop_codon:yes gene_type:complete